MLFIVGSFTADFFFLLIFVLNILLIFYVKKLLKAVFNVFSSEGYFHYFILILSSTNVNA